MNLTKTMMIVHTYRAEFSEDELIEILGDHAGVALPVDPDTAIIEDRARMRMSNPLVLVWTATEKKQIFRWSFVDHAWEEEELDDG